MLVLGVFMAYHLIPYSSWILVGGGLVYLVGNIAVVGVGLYNRRQYYLAYRKRCAEHYDKHLETEPMPPELQKTPSVIN